MSENIAIIPARGGSKRVPKKNILEFFGKPMIAWTIEAAIKSNTFTKVLVSTDCEEIAKISKNYGAEVPFLRKSYADDISPISLATHDALIQAEDFWSLKFDTVTQLMPNCPLRNDKDIVEFTRAVDVQQLPELSQKAICFLKAKNHAWKGVKVEFVTNPTPEQSEKLKENEDKAKSYLVAAGSKAYNTCLIKNNLKGE